MHCHFPGHLTSARFDGRKYNLDVVTNEHLYDNLRLEMCIEATSYETTPVKKDNYQRIGGTNALCVEIFLDFIWYVSCSDGKNQKRKKTLRWALVHESRCQLLGNFADGKLSPRSALRFMEVLHWSPLLNCDDVRRFTAHNMIGTHKAHGSISLYFL